ncbi:MAG: cytochrome c [Zoogloeaceae bacterium]|nr:cytochrome c [Zoogloeaceae bacterium]
MRPLRVLACAAAALCSVAAAAQGEHERRLAAELAVMAGDLRRIRSPDELPLHREGLRARLAGALSSLPLLLRQAGADPAAVPALRQSLARSDWRALRAGLDALTKRHPFAAGALLPQAATPERLRLGEAIHRQACAGCHDAPATGTPLPAFNLFEQAKRLPRAEFAARLLLGVRGDRGSAWRNPFSDLELGALLAYYGNGEPAAAARK